MNHDFESKDWADNHHKLSEDIDRLFSHIGRTAVSCAKAVRARFNRARNRQTAAPDAEATVGSKPCTGPL